MASFKTKPTLAHLLQNAAIHEGDRLTQAYPYLATLVETYTTLLLQYIEREAERNGKPQINAPSLILPEDSVFRIQKRINDMESHCRHSLTYSVMAESFSRTNRTHERKPKQWPPPFNGAQDDKL